MSTTEPVRQLGPLTIVHWHDSDLPPGMPGLVAEAEATGVEWMSRFTLEWRARPLLAEGEALFLALNGLVPVGMAAITADPYVADRQTGRLRYIYAATAVRGRGLLRTFVELSLAHAAGRWRRLRLHTDNPRAARVYESYGFAATGAEPHSTHVRGTL